MGIWNLTVFLPNQWKKKDAEERGRGEQRNANGFFWSAFQTLFRTGLLGLYYGHVWRC